MDIIIEVYYSMLANQDFPYLANYGRLNFGIYDCPIGKYAEKAFADGNHRLYCSLIHNLTNNDSTKSRIWREIVLKRLKNTQK